MKRAKFTGHRGLVVIGDRALEPGDIVGEPGSGAQVIGCTGVAEYLLKRRDFEEVFELNRRPQDLEESRAKVDAVAAHLDTEDEE